MADEKEEKEVVPIGFAPYQIDSCEEAPKPPPLKEICRECTPDPKFIAPNWKLMVEKPYFNKKTCEYMVTVTQDKFSESYRLGNREAKYDFRNYPPGPKRDAALRDFIQPALVLMLEHFNKLVADQVICAFHNGPALNGLTPEELLTNYNDYKTVFEILAEEPVGPGRHYPDVTPCLDYTKPVGTITSGEAEQSLLSLTDIILQSKTKYPEVTNPYALELYAYAKDFWIEPRSGLLKVSIAIPSFVFDAVPPAPTTKDIEKESQDLKDEVELEVRQLFGQIKRLSNALSIYSKYQSYFHQSQQGKIIYKESKKTYYASDYSKRVNTFYKRLKAVAKSNGWNIRSASGSVVNKNARLLKIEFEKVEKPPPVTKEAIKSVSQTIKDNNPSPEPPGGEKSHYKIKSIKVKKRGCKYVKLTGGGIKQFIKEFNKDPTLLGYIAKLDKIDTDLQAKKSYPWMDFLVKYTYPLLTIRYGELSKEDVEATAGSCIAENLAAFGMDLQDYILNEVLSLLDVFQYEWNSKSCITLNQYDEEPEKTLFKKKKNPKGKDVKKEIEGEEFERLGKLLADQQKKKQEYETNLADLKASVPTLEKSLESMRLTLSLLEGGTISLRVQNKDEINNKKQQIPVIESKINNTKGLIAKLEKAYTDHLADMESGARKKEMRKQKRKETSEARKIRRAEDNPYVAKAKKLAYAEFGVQDNIIASLIGLEDYQKNKDLASEVADGGEEELKKLSRRLSMCNLDNLLLASVRCLMSGVTQEAAFRKIVKATLKGFDIDVFGYFVQHLPADAQEELRVKMEKEFKGLPLPWEDGYDAGSMDKTNPYTKYLKSPSEKLERKQNRNERRTDKKQDQIEEKDTELTELRVNLAAARVAKAKAQEQFDQWSSYINGYMSSPERAAATVKERLAEEEAFREEELIRKQAVKDAQALIDELTSEEATKAARAIVEEQNELRMKKSELEDKWSELTDEQRVQAAKNASEASRIDLDGDPDNKGSSGTYGTALGNVQELLVDAYIEWILDIVQVDQLMTILDGFPGARIVPFMITQTKCATQGMFKPPIKSFMSTLSLDTCGSVQGGFTVPEKIKPIPNFFKGNFLLRRLRNLFIKKIEEAMIGIVKALLVKIFGILDDLLCESLGVAGGALMGNKGFADALGDAFCPDGDDEDLKNAGRGMMNAAGLPADSWECLYNLLNTILSKQDYINLMTNTPQNMDQRTLNIIAEAVQAFCPEFADVFGTPEQVGDVFGQGGNLIPPNLKDNLGATQPTQDEPLYDAICLTSEQYEDWKNMRVGVYTDMGLDQKTAEDMVNKANDRALDDIGTLAEALNDDLLGQALDDLLKPAADCAVDKTALVFEDDALAEDKRQAINSMFEQIERKFHADLIGRPRSILNNILRDSNNARLRGHEMRVNMPVLFANYVNDLDQWRFREENGSRLYTWQMRKMGVANEERAKGMFPETVGIWMKQKLEEEKLVYKSGTGPQVTLNFEDNGNGEGDPTWKFELNYQVKKVDKSLKRISAWETYLEKPTRKEKKQNPELENMTGDELKFKTLDFDVEDYFDLGEYSDFDYDNSKPYQAMVFKSFLEKKVNGNINMNGKLMKAYDETNSTILNFVRKAVLETPTGDVPIGFNFGYDFQQAITFADLTYVDPEATSDESTWKYSYSNSDGILGKSATNNPRVHFLDPAKHGGSYKRPKIYVEPATYNGWLGMIKVFIPEEKECEDKDTGFLDITSLSKRAKQIEKDVPFDERLELSPDCRLEPPFDKISAPATHGIMEGTVLATIRIYATEFILRSLPTFGSVAFNENNVDGTLTNMIMSEMRKGMTAQTSRFNIVQGYTYYLLFLEQAVQTVQRQIKDGLLEENEIIKANFDKINEIQRSYDPMILKNLIRGTAIVAFGEYWQEELFKKGVDLNKQETYKKISLKIARMLTPFKINLVAKIDSIYEVLSASESIAGELLKKEISIISKKINFNLRPRPHIYDIRKTLLSRSGIILGSTLRSGETEVEQPVFEDSSGAYYGNIPGCYSEEDASNPLNGSVLKIGSENLVLPDRYDKLSDFISEDAEKLGLDIAAAAAQALFENATISIDPRELQAAAQAAKEATQQAATTLIGEFIGQKLTESLSIDSTGYYYLEKYLRVTEKSESGSLTPQVYNIKEFQEILRNRAYDPDSLISDNFGNAKLIDGEDDDKIVKGTVGIKFGTRLIYCPPSEFTYEVPAEATTERTYSLPPARMKVEFESSFIKLLEKLPEAVQEFISLSLNSIEVDIVSSTRAIPVVTYEKDILDRKISDLDLDDEDFGEELKCYIDNLANEKDFNVLFDVIFPVRPYVSLFATYSYYCFINSIGQDVGDPKVNETDEDAGTKANDAWKGDIFRRSKKAARKLFNSTYRTDDDVKEENNREKKNLNVDFLKNLLPGAYLNLDFSVRWWQKWRIVSVSPFDDDGNECKSEFQKMFD
jgi:hypothetical protein